MKPRKPGPKTNRTTRKAAGYRGRRASIERLETRLALHVGDGPWLDHLLDDNQANDLFASKNPPVTNEVAAVQPAGAQPVDIGQFGPLQNWPIEWINAVMLPTGKVLGYDRTLNLTLWDPATNVFTTPASPGYNFFCTGTSLLSNGDVLMVGGAVVDTVGLPYAAIYNPFTDSWTQLGNMNAGRWYPSVTTLANGDALVLSGDTNGNVTNPLPQVYDSTTGTWKDLTGAVQTLPFYPRTFSAPNGDAFVAGPQGLTEYIDTSGVGAILPVGYRVDPDRNFGSAVMYAPGKVLYVGGGSPASNSAEVIDLNAANPAWREVAPMAFARRNCNATLLPDGEVLVNGGNDGSGTYDGNDIMAAEIWNPKTETFRTVANASDIRWYHSTSLLLPDGRVITTSGDDHLTGEVYSPPYLFEGPQPTISSAPGTVQYGDNFFVGTPDAASITSVRWIRMGSATHAQNWDQYMQDANFSVSAGGTGLNVSAPPTADASPPGYYYLFILKGDVPSVAKIIKVGADLPAVSVTGTSVTEGPVGSTVNATFTVTLAQASAKTVTVNFATADGTALAGTNYVAQTGTVTFPPLSTTQTITVPIINDGVLDPNELFTVNLSAPVNAVVGIGTAQGLIRDHNALPVLQIKGTTMVEGDSGTSPATFVVTLSSPSATPVTVAYSTADGIARAPQDYVAKAGTLTFAPGVTQQTVTIAVVGDTNYAPNKTFFVNLSAPVGATLEIPQAQALVYNNDPPPSADLQGPATFPEPAAGVTANITLTATLSAPSEKTTVVPWTTAADGTAQAGVNFVDQSGLVTFLPGVTSQTFTVQVIGDGVKTANPTFSVQMQSELQNAIYGNRYTGVTLVDSNTLPAVSLSDATVTEGNAGTTFAVFTATLTAPMTQAVTVHYATSAGTATPGVDYVETAGTLTFAPGVTSLTISVPVKGDAIPESDETFNLTLTNPVNCQLDIDKAVGTIIDDDGAPVPPAPTDLNAVAGFGIVQLTWDAMPGATSYNVYRGTNDSGEGTTPIATGIVGTSFTDTGLVNRQDYYYRVTAVNSPQAGTSWESSQSAEFAIAPNPYDFSQGFPGTNVDPTVAAQQYLSSTRSVLSLNGLNVQDTRTFNNNLQLTDGGTQETDSAFALLPVNVNRFTTQFTYQATPSLMYTAPLADGITFTIQGVGPTVLGDPGGGLGYAGIGQSVAVKFDLFDNLGEGNDSTGLYTNGIGPAAVNSIDLTGTGIDLKDGDWFNIGMVYDGTTLVVTITDTVTQAVATQSYPVNIPAIVGGNAAFVGFTGATGGLGAVQKIHTWTYTPAPSAPTTLHVTSSSAAQVGLSWTNTDPNTTSVLIERKTGLNGTYAQIGSTTTAAANTYTDLAVTAGTTYYYRVRAVDNGSTSLYSNEVNATTQVGTQTDLQITNTDGQTNAAPGAPITYTVVVTNAGPIAVTGATVTDTLPAKLTGATFTATATGGATGFTAAGTGSINNTVTMPAGSTITYVVSATVSPAATGTLADTASVAAPAGITDTNLANNSVTDTDTLTPQADLKITNSDGATTAVPGAAIAYTIVVTNSGPSNVTGATVTDTLPATLTGATYTATATGGATGFTATGTGSINNTVTMPAGSTITYVVSATISPAATGTLANIASVAAPAGVTDTNPANNSVTDTDTLTPQADLKITNTDGATTIVQGATVTYTIVVTNSGPSRATGATVADTFASILSAVTYTATATGGATGFTASGTGNINNTVTLFVGSTITYVVKGTLSGSATGSLSNSATVTAPAGVTDPNPANNSVTDTDTILPIINFPGGFTGSTSKFLFNGASAKIVGANLQLTDGATGEAASIYYGTQVNVTRFNTSFNMQVTPASPNSADGMTFILQGAGPTNVGAAGGGLGSSGIGKSVEVKFDLYSNSGEGPNSTGLYLKGASPTATNSINLAGTGIDLHSGHVFNVNMTYDGTTLRVTITDSLAAAQATQSYTVNIPAVVGANTAYVGFTGATGGLTAVQKILNWTYAVTAATAPASQVASSAVSSLATPSAAPVQASAMSATQARSLVAGIYQDILGHAPDAASWNRLAGQLQSGASVQSIAQSLLTSPEHYGQVVDGFYATYFKQTADAPSRNALVQALQQGRSADQEATDFLLSDEYAKLHPSNVDFISSLFQDVLGRAADANGQANFVSALATGQTRAAVVTSFVTSTERYRHIVDQIYGEVFQHPADPTSLQLYSSQLQSGTYTPDSLELMLIGSDEFFKLNGNN